MGIDSHKVNLSFTLVLDKSIEIVLIALLVFSALLFSPYTESTFLLTKEVFFRIAVFFCIALWLTKIALSSKIEFVKTPLNIPLLLLTISALTSFLAARAVYLSQRDFINLTASILLYLVIIDVIRTKEQILKLLLVLICLTGITALYGTLQFYGMDYFKYWVGNIGRKRMFATFGNPNFLAEYLICILPISFVIALLGRKKIYSVVCGLSFFISCLALLISQTRASWIGAFVSFIFMALLFVFKDKAFITKNKKKLLIIPLLIIVVCITFVGLNLIRHNISDSYALGQRIKTIFNDPFRVFVWKATWQMFRDHPLTGVGLGNFKLLYVDYQALLLSRQQLPSYIITSNVMRAHNEYLQVAAEMGLPGLVIVCWLIIALFRHGLWVFKNIPDVEGRRLSAGILSGCVALLIYTFFSFPFHLASTSTVFICLAAIITSTGRAYGAPMSCKKISLPFLHSRIISFILIMAGLTTAILLSVNAVKAFTANIYLSRAIFMVKKDKNLNRARTILDKGILINPDESKLYFVRALAKHKQNEDRASIIKDLNQALTLFRDANIYHNLGTAYMQHNQTEQAIQTWEYIISVRPNLTKTLLSLGRACLEENKLDQAEKWFKQALHYYPENISAHYLLGNVYLRQEEKLKAKEEWEKTNQLSPQHIRSLYNLGNLSYSQRKYEESLKYWQKALELEPDNYKLKKNIQFIKKKINSGKNNTGQ